MMKEQKLFFEVFIEISQGSNMKYEYDKDRQRFKLDRILYGSHVYPGNYGFIERTLELDGDPVDVLVCSGVSVFPGCLVDVRIIGGLEMIDDGEIDNKLIGIPAGDHTFHDVKNITDMNLPLRAKIYDFFQNYKKLEQKKVILKGWFDADKAINMIWACQKRWIDQCFPGSVSEQQEALKQLESQIKLQKSMLESR